MVDTADVVVIGGGVIGTSIACALVSSGVLATAFSGSGFKIAPRRGHVEPTR